MLLPRRGGDTPAGLGVRRHSRCWSPLSTEEVLEEVNQRLKKDPKDLKALLQRSRALMCLGDHRSAYADLSVLLGSIQGSGKTEEVVQALFYRGMCHVKLSCLDEAIADFTAALDVDPTHGRSAYERAACHNRKGNFTAAILDYERALQHDTGCKGQLLERNARSRFALALRKEGASSSLLVRATGPPTTDTASSTNTNGVCGNFGSGWRSPAGGPTDTHVQASGTEDKASTVDSVPGTPFGSPEHSRPVSTTLSSRDCEMAELHHQRGLVYRRQGDLARAIDEYTAAILLDPKNFKALFNRGFCHDKVGNYDEAIRDYEAAMHLEPGYAYTYYNLGISHDHKGDRFEEAIRMFDKAIALDGSNADFYHNRGFSRRKLGDYREAVKDYTTALTLDPQHFKAYYNRACCYDKLGEIATAIDDYTNAIAIHRDYPNAYHNRGTALEKIGRVDDAIEDYTQAIKLDGKNPFTYFARAMAYDRLGSHSAALDDLTRAITLSPNNALFYRNRGSVYQNIERFQEAIQDYDVSLKLTAHDVVSGCGAAGGTKRVQEVGVARLKTYNNRGFCFACRGRYEEAVQDFSEVIAVDPDNALALYNRGVSRDRLGSHGHAVEDFSRLIEVDPGNANAHFCRGSALESLRNYAAALDDYAVALALDVDQSGLADDEAALKSFKAKHRATVASQRVLRFLKEQREPMVVQRAC